MIKLLTLSLFFLFSISSFSQVARNVGKKKKPKYELGAGFISLSTSNYPGAKKSTTRFIPFPWFIYRGEFLRADEEGTRAKLIDNENLELGMSGGFNFPIDSSENEAREGMPNSDAIFGIGPGLIYRFKNNSKTYNFTLGLGLRVNYAVGYLDQIKEQGWIIEPNIRYWYKPSVDSNWTIFSSLSYSAADKKYNKTFYQVDSEYETSKRRAYDAKAGTVDIAATLGLAYDFSKKAGFFMGVNYSNLSTAANKRSSLVEEEHNINIIFGCSWLLYESDELVY